MGQGWRDRRPRYCSGPPGNRAVAKRSRFSQNYTLKKKGKRLLTGLSIGEAIAAGKVCVLINNIIKIHPMALVRFDNLEDKTARKRIQELTRGYKDKTEYFVAHLAQGIAKIAAAHYPKPVVVRTSDFKTNEYANLLGGKQFEPHEDNPMLGFRGASRYYSDRYRNGFTMECRALKRVREEIGLDNVIIVLPFCRTPEEADEVTEVLAKNGLKRGKHGLKV